MRGTVLVTGAAGGIGADLVKTLSAQNWSVIGTDHPTVTPEGKIQNLCKAWIPLKLESISNSEKNLEEFRERVKEATIDFKLTGIVHNAAIQVVNKFLELTQEEWNKTMAINLMAPVAINRTLIPLMSRNNGSIVHIGSIHSKMTKPYFTAYATSKAALAGLTKAMAVELGRSIRVNAIEPGAISTPMLEAGFAKNPELKEKLSAYHPTAKIGRTSDVSQAVLFLLDPGNCFLNGCTLSLDGGIQNRLHDPA